ncbi:MAG: hypothetical protein WDO24_20465 [Pseudomonadota bacterium]
MSQGGDRHSGASRSAGGKLARKVASSWKVKVLWSRMPRVKAQRIPLSR